MWQVLFGVVGADNESVALASKTLRGISNSEIGGISFFRPRNNKFLHWQELNLFEKGVNYLALKDEACNSRKPSGTKQGTQ